MNINYFKTILNKPVTHRTIYLSILQAWFTALQKAVYVGTEKKRPPDNAGGDPDFRIEYPPLQIAAAGGYIAWRAYHLAIRLWSSGFLDSLHFHQKGACAAKGSSLFSGRGLLRGDF